MKHLPQHLLDDANALALTSHEKSAAKAAIRLRMALSLTADEKLAGRRVLQHAVYADPAPASARRWSLFRLPRVHTATLSVLLVFGFSFAGVSYAAEGALPGDALYGVKIYVNEAVRTKLQFSAPNRARWAVERLRRRMDELHTLKARGVTNDDLDVAIGDHVEHAARDVEVEIEALPAAATERAAMRTAVNAAIGDDQDSLRRASRINRALKNLKKRAERFEKEESEAAIVPDPLGREPKIAPVPSANARARNKEKNERAIGNDDDDEGMDENEVKVEQEAHIEEKVDVEIPEIDLDAEGILR